MLTCTNVVWRKSVLQDDQQYKEEIKQNLKRIKQERLSTFLSLE